MKKRFRTVTIGLGVLAALIFVAACEGPVTPEPTPTPKPAPIPDINSVAFGARRYVAVGDEGAIFSSSDGGSTWSRRESAVSFEPARTVSSGLGEVTGMIHTSPRLFMPPADSSRWAEAALSLPVLMGLYGKKLYRTRSRVFGLSFMVEENLSLSGMVRP